MEWIVSAQLVTLTGSLILIFTYLSLYLQERQGTSPCGWRVGHFTV